MDRHHDLVLERLLAAPRELVWKAWSSPEHLKRWRAPKPYETPECEIDLRPGGIFRTRMTGPDGLDSTGTGCFLDVVAGQRVVWTNALLPGYRPVAAVPEDCGGSHSRRLSPWKTPATAGPATRRLRRTGTRPTATPTRRWAFTTAGGSARPNWSRSRLDGRDGMRKTWRSIVER